jgi:hypothetical protein
VPIGGEAIVIVSGATPGEVFAPTESSDSLIVAVPEEMYFGVRFLALELA